MLNHAHRNLTVCGRPSAIRSTGATGPQSGRSIGMGGLALLAAMTAAGCSHSSETDRAGTAAASPPPISRELAGNVSASASQSASMIESAQPK